MIVIYFITVTQAQDCRYIFLSIV